MKGTKDEGVDEMILRWIWKSSPIGIFSIFVILFVSNQNYTFYELIW
jgi:hypothetical protein